MVLGNLGQLESISRGIENFASLTNEEEKTSALSHVLQYLNSDEGLSNLSSLSFSHTLHFQHHTSNILSGVSRYLVNEQDSTTTNQLLEIQSCVNTVIRNKSFYEHTHNKDVDTVCSLLKEPGLFSKEITGKIFPLIKLKFSEDDLIRIFNSSCPENFVQLVELFGVSITSVQKSYWKLFKMMVDRYPKELGKKFSKSKYNLLVHVFNTFKQQGSVDKGVLESCIKLLEHMDLDQINELYADQPYSAAYAAVSVGAYEILEPLQQKGVKLTECVHANKSPMHILLQKKGGQGQVAEEEIIRLLSAEKSYASFKDNMTSFISSALLGQKYECVNHLINMLTEESGEKGIDACIDELMNSECLQDDTLLALIKHCSKNLVFIQKLLERGLFKQLDRPKIIELRDLLGKDTVLQALFKDCELDLIAYRLTSLDESVTLFSEQEALDAIDKHGIDFFLSKTTPEGNSLLYIVAEMGWEDLSSKIQGELFWGLFGEDGFVLQNKKGETPLHLAVNDGIFEQLCQNMDASEVNVVTTILKNTVAHAQACSLKRLYLLHKAGASLSAVNEEGKTPLCIYLLNTSQFSGFEIYDIGDDVFTEEELFVKLLDSCVDELTQKDRSAIFCAAIKCEAWDVAKRLMQYDLDLDFKFDGDVICLSYLGKVKDLVLFDFMLNHATKEDLEQVNLDIGKEKVANFSSPESLLNFLMKAHDLGVNFKQKQVGKSSPILHAALKLEHSQIETLFSKMSCEVVDYEGNTILSLLIGARKDKSADFIIDQIKNQDFYKGNSLALLKLIHSMSIRLSTERKSSCPIVKKIKNNLGYVYLHFKVSRSVSNLYMIYNKSKLEECSFSEKNINNLKSSSFFVEGVKNSFKNLKFLKKATSFDLLSKQNQSHSIQDFKDIYRDSIHVIDRNSDMTSLLDSIQSGKLCFLHLGFTGHAITLGFYKDYYWIGNRGCESKLYPAIFRKFNKDKLNESILNKLFADELINQKQLSFGSNLYCYSGLEKDLESENTDICVHLASQSLLFPFQKMGNCTWTSPEVVLLGSVCLFLTLNHPEVDLSNLNVEKLDEALKGILDFHHHNVALGLLMNVEELFKGAADQNFTLDFSESFIDETWKSLFQYCASFPDLMEKAKALKESYEKKMLCRQNV